MLKIKDEVDLKEIKEEYDLIEDSFRLFAYDSLSNPKKVFNIYISSKEIIFTNGEFKKGKDIIKKLEKAGIVEKVDK